MPTYEYKCSKCEEVFEVRQKFADEPLSVHEACGGAVERLLSSPALQFKGSGFYITDYKKSSNSSPSKPNGGSSSSEPAAPKPASKDSSSKTS